MAVTCPTGKKVVGLGGAVIGSNGEGIPVVFTPDPGLTQVFVIAVPDQDGLSASSSGTEATAMCANPPPGLQMVRATSLGDSDPASVSAVCPPGKNLLGGGGALGGPGFSSGEVSMDDIRPDPALKSMTVTGLEDEDGTELEWDVTAVAICAND